MIDYYIPDSYVELEYLIQDNPAFIKTDIIPQNNYIFKATLKIINLNLNNADVGAFGVSSGDYILYQYTHIIYNMLVNTQFTALNQKNKPFNWNIKKTLSQIVKGYEGTNNIPFYIGAYVSGNNDFPPNWTNNIVGKSVIFHHYNYQIFNDKNECIFNAVPVRRLGDGIVGIFDTINQKFYDGDNENYRFKGSNRKLIKNEYFYLLQDHSYNFKYVKRLDVYRTKKNFISNAYSALSTLSQKIMHTIRKDDNDLEYYMLSKYKYVNDTTTSPNFRRNNQNYTDIDFHIQNSNPNWNILKSPNITESNLYETNNEILYVANKSRINVYNTGTTTPVEDDGFL